MPRRVNPALLCGLVIVSVLLFALSASAAQETVPAEGVPVDTAPVDASPGDAAPVDAAPGDAAPVDSTLPTAQAARPAPEDEAQDAPIQVPEGTLERFDEIKNKAEAEDGELKNKDFEERSVAEKITQKRRDLVDVESELVEDQSELDEAENELGEQARKVYKYGQGGVMDVLLKARDLRGFVNLLGLGVQGLKDDHDKFQEVGERKYELDATREKLKENKEELETQLQDLKEANRQKEEYKEQAQNHMEAAQDFVESLDPAEKKEIIEKEPADNSAGALDHTEKLLLQASQEQLDEETESPDENPGNETARNEQALEPEVAGSDDQGRQVKVAQAVAETIREWPAIKEQVGEGSGENAKKPDEGAGEIPDQNPAGEQLDAAIKRKAEAQEEARPVAEQVAEEMQTMADAAEKVRQADEAEKKARQAPEPVPDAEKEKLRAAAEDARLQANFATEQAGKEKQAAEEIATQAADKLNAADKELADAQNAAGKVTPFALDPLNPSLDSTGKPISPGAGGGVLGEAKGWLGVPYDYSHSAGQTRKAVDCSAFTAAVYNKFGIALPDSPAGQMGMGAPVSGTPKAGDLVFWSEDGSGVPTHVGIANGDGTTTHSSSFTGEVSVTPMKYINGYLGARRLI
jgi:cell wall-associated NlpC family hydrolase/peptidoglycan hydrolase CwlO-like protein